MIKLILMLIISFEQLLCDRHQAKRLTTSVRKYIHFGLNLQTQFYIRKW